jgi:hypothetical protein
MYPALFLRLEPLGLTRVARAATPATTPGVSIRSRIADPRSPLPHDPMRSTPIQGHGYPGKTKSMELSPYERRVLTELENDLQRDARMDRVRALISAWWLPVVASLMAGMLCVFAGVAFVFYAAAVIIGLMSLGLGILWGWAIHRPPGPS